MAIPEHLRIDFIDEDTPTWMAAAQAIGNMGQEAWPFIQENLLDADNIHRQRHAWCAVAAYLGAVDDPGGITAQVHRCDWMKTKARQEPETVELLAFLRGCLTDMVIEGYRLSGATLGEADDFAPFAEYRESLIKDTAARRDDQAARGNTKGAEKLAVDLADLQTNATPMAAAIRGLKSAYPEKPWKVASFLAGVSAPLLSLLGLDLRHLTVAICARARSGGDELAWITPLPRIIRACHEHGDTEAAGAAVRYLLDHLPTTTESTHSANLIMDLEHAARVAGVDIAADVTDYLSVGLADAQLHRFMAWRTDPSEQTAVALIRSCEERFCRRELWEESTDSGRAALRLYYMASLDPRVDGPLSVVTLDHRIRVTFRAIERWQKQNTEIVIVLVRLLKKLLHEELVLVKARGKAHGVLRTAHRQVHWILPLISRWNLRGICNKDLATVAARVLSAASDAMADGPKGDVTYRSLLYTILHALPEEKFTQEVALYAQNGLVAAHFEALSHFFAASNDEQREPLLATGFLEAVWAPSTPIESDLLPQLHRGFMKALVRQVEFRGQPLSDQAKQMLRWIIEVRQRSVVERESGFPARTTSAYDDEKEGTIRIRTDAVLHRFDAAFNQLSLSESQLVDSAAEPEAVGGTLRRALGDLRTLEELSREHLPFGERWLALHAIRRRCGEFEQRLRDLGNIIDGENEQAALALVANDSQASDEERSLVARWMLKRFMIRELAGAAGGACQCFRLRWVLPVILGPYLLAIAAHHFWPGTQGPLTGSWISGLPFLASVVTGIGLMVVTWKARTPAPGRIARASLLMPQMMGTLFFGMMESLGADEFWSAGFLANPIIRLLNIVLFLVASGLFVRHVMLRDQQPWSGQADLKPETRRKESRRILRRRTRDLLAMGLMQSFVLVLVFSLLKGTVMGSASRADLVLTSLDPVARSVGAVLPVVIRFGGSGWPFTLSLFPLAVLSWTIQVFFFSAIYERIISGR